MLTVERLFKELRIPFDVHISMSDSSRHGIELELDKQVNAAGFDAKDYELYLAAVASNIQTTPQMNCESCKQLILNFDHGAYEVAYSKAVEADETGETDYPFGEFLGDSHKRCLCEFQQLKSWLKKFQLDPRR